MAPKADKKKGEPPPVEEEIVLPPGLEFTEPSFKVSVVHVVSHIFTIEGEAPEEGSPGPLSQFDVCATLATKLREVGLDPDAPQSRRRVLIERADLEALGDGGAAAKKPPPKKGEPVVEEDPNAPAGLAKYLLQKVQEESAGRKQKKVTAAKKRAIAEFQGTRLESPEGGQPETDEPEAFEPDLTMVLVGYPANPQDVLELESDGVFGALSSWVSVHLAGETVEEAGDPPERWRRQCETPALLAELFQLVQAARMGEPLAGCTIRTVPNSHLLALPAEGAPQRLMDSVLGAANEELSWRLRYDAWLEEALKVSGTTRSESQPTEMRLYARLADSVDPLRQDTPLLLHCMCEQVALNLSGDVAPDLSGGQDEAGRPIDGVEVELQLLEDCIDSLHGDLCLSDLGDPPGLAAAAAAAEAGKASTDEDEQEGSWDNQPPEALGDDDLLLPFLDRASCRHPNGELPGGQSEAAAVSRMLACCKALGADRLGLPPQPPLTTAQRSALRNRLHAYMPEEVPLVDVERMYILTEFARLLEAVQPERKWLLTDRVFHERIQSSLLVQAMLHATRGEGFVDTAYLRRHDCLLVALHQRLLPGRVLWHSWMGDFLEPGASDRLCPTPTFNDWRQLISGGCACSSPSSLRLLEGYDARELGYCNIVEKIHVPADRSVILQTTIRRGLKESFPRPDQSVAREEAMAFDAAPAKRRALVRVLKGGMAFGIVSDELWSGKAERFKAQREEKEQAAAAAEEEARKAAEEQAAADALRGAQGLPAQDEDGEDDDEEEDEEDEEEDMFGGLAVSERRLEDLRFGKFWMVFPDSSRCTFQMEHERQWYEDGAILFDVTFSRPGMQFSYSLPCGLTIQVFSDATVRQLWPFTGGSRVASGGNALQPGGALDFEIARTVSPFGVLAREMFSGRREVHHPDGTRAWRNPTVEEMRSRFADMGNEGARPASLELMERMVEAYGSLHKQAPLTSSPTEESKRAGLPGHWRVTRPDGVIFGRVAAPPPPEVPAEPKAAAPDGDAARTEAQAVPTDGGAAEDTEGAEPAEPAEPAPGLLELLEGQLTDEGTVIEYVIGDVSTTLLIDPHTGQHTAGNAESLLVIEGPQGTPKSCLLPDGTRIFRRPTSDGYRVTIEKEGVARVHCEVSLQNYHPTEPTTFSEVECSDGTQVQVVPQKLNDKGELICSHPKVGQCPEFCTNAMVYLRRPDGFVLRSKGDGDVHMVGAPEVAELGEREALLSAPEGGEYSVHCDGDVIKMKDADGNLFEVRGDQSVDVMLAVAMRDECEEPRCTEPTMPYRHPDAKYLPLPDGAPHPRLFVIYGDGEAEEILPTSEVREALRVAREDPATLFLEGEPMSAPMQLCKSHTMYRTVPMDPPMVPPTPLVLPPAVAGFEAAAPAAPRTFTELRQIVEYPAITEERWQMFQDALARYKQEEETHHAGHENYGLGRVKDGRRLRAAAVLVAEAGA